jgi:hypothetical protein
LHSAPRLHLSVSQELHNASVTQGPRFVAAFVHRCSRHKVDLRFSLLQGPQQQPVAELRTLLRQVEHLDRKLFCEDAVAQTRSKQCGDTHVICYHRLAFAGNSMDGTSENQPGKCGPLVRNASIAQARGCLQSLCSLGLHTFFRSALQIFLLAWDNSVTDVCFAGKKHTHTHEGDLDSTCSKVIAQDFAHCQSKWWRIAFVHV